MAPEGSEGGGANVGEGAAACGSGNGVRTTGGGAASGPVAGGGVGRGPEHAAIINATIAIVQIGSGAFTGLIVSSMPSTWL